MFGLFRLMATIAACATSVASVHAADFREGFIPSEVVLEGTIEAGDYDKLRTFVEENSPRSIYLASPGGNLAEAIKMGRLVRALKLKTMVPSEKNPRFRDKLAVMNKLKNPETNYMCASACFFVFVAGVNRITDNFSDEPILGIHRPYLSENDLKGMNGDQAIAAASQTRMKVENYLKEMGIQAKYSDRMFLVPKNEVRWISEDDFEADFKGFIPELQDWIAAKCDTRTDVEKAAWENLKDKSPARKTAAERLISDMLLKKMSELDECGSKELSTLSHQAQLKMFWEPRKAALCADYRSDENLSYLLAKLATAVPNEPSAAALRDAAQNATLCGDFATRARIIRPLAERGDAGAQLILGAMYHYGTGEHLSQDAISPDKPEGVRWFRRAADQGNIDAQGHLVSIYYFGKGVPQNYVEMLKWLILGDLQKEDKDKTSSSLRNQYTSKMTPEQIAEAQRLANQWKPTPERVDLDLSSTLSTKTKPSWWQFWNRSPYLPH